MVRFSNSALLEMLMENSRASFTELAKKFGVTETAVRKRVRKMERDGTIRKYTVEFDAKKLGFQVRALVGIDTKPECFIPAIDKLKKMKKVSSLYSSSGDHMIMVDCMFEDSNGLSAFIKKIEQIEGITKICPSLILEKIK
ncbi:Lrp/AsnC family transcriptional regulator [Candidatus Micrarchaeota archaeon]|nr:Lrp/AsnC family transcriptional regulator [Candidatus Micrarchaeota archaeon]